MDAPLVHRFVDRSAVIGHRLGPFALLAAVGGFTVWLAALHSAPSFAAAGWVLGALGVVLGLMGALASSLGLFVQERRKGALGGLAIGRTCDRPADADRSPHPARAHAVVAAMDPSPEYHRAVAKRAWLSAIVAGGVAMLVLMAVAAAWGVLLMHLLIGGAA